MKDIKIINVTDFEMCDETIAYIVKHSIRQDEYHIVDDFTIKLINNKVLLDYMFDFSQKKLEILGDLIRIAEIIKKERVVLFDIKEDTTILVA